MKWTDKKVQALRELCEKGTPNKDIATILQCNVSDVYAKRSQLGITIPKIKAAQQQTTTPNNPHIEVKKAFRSLHDSLGIAAISKQTNKELAKKYVNTNELLYCLENLLYKD